MADIRRQCLIEIEDRLGRLAEITDRIRQAEINILSICAWADRGVARITMVTDDHDKVCMAITPIVDRCEFRDVLWTSIPNKPGALDGVARKLSDAGIRINLIYGFGGDAEEATVIIDTDNNLKAAAIL